MELNTKPFWTLVYLRFLDKREKNKEKLRGRNPIMGLQKAF